MLPIGNILMLPCGNMARPSSDNPDRPPGCPYKSTAAATGPRQRTGPHAGGAGQVGVARLEAELRDEVGDALARVAAEDEEVGLGTLELEGKGRAILRLHLRDEGVVGNILW